jgi:hypothetical protein
LGHWSECCGIEAEQARKKVSKAGNNGKER